MRPTTTSQDGRLTAAVADPPEGLFWPLHGAGPGPRRPRNAGEADPAGLCMDRRADGQARHGIGAADAILDKPPLVEAASRDAAISHGDAAEAGSAGLGAARDTVRRAAGGQRRARARRAAATR